MKHTVAVQIWIGLEAEGADGPGTARDVELDVEDGKIVEARMYVPRVRWECVAIPMPLLRAMVSERDWPAFEAYAARLAERQCEQAAIDAATECHERNGFVRMGVAS
jgi:hypothetical protein